MRINGLIFIFGLVVLLGILCIKLLNLPARLPVAHAQTSSPALSTYIWNPQPLIATSSANPVLTQKLTNGIEQMIQDKNGDGIPDHLAPLLKVRGRTNELDWYFINPAETILTLSQAYPYVPSQTQAKIKSFLLEEISLTDPAQADLCLQWGNLPCFQKGNRREYATPPLTDSYFFHDLCLSNLPDNPSASCNPPPNIANLYGLWAYGYYVGQWSYLQTHYVDIKNIYINFKSTISNNAANIKYFPQVGGLIGFARIAKELGDTTSANEAANFASAALQSISTAGGFTNFRTNAESTIATYNNFWTTDPYAYWTGSWNLPYFLYDFSSSSGILSDQVYMTLFPEELGRFVHDYPNPNHEAQTLINQVQVFAPGWDISLPDHETVGENTYDNPDIHWSMFKLHAYVLGESQNQLINHIGSSISIGDLFYLQMITTALQAPSGTVSSPTPAASLTPTPAPSATPRPSTTPPSSATPAPSASPNPCNGADVNHDGIVNLLDYSIVVSNFGKSEPPGTNGDINGNGVVDLLDYSIVVSNFGKTGC